MLVRIFCNKGISVLLMIVRYNKFDVFVVCLFNFFSVRLKIVGNMIELYKLMVSIDYIVILLFVSMDVIMRIIEVRLLKLSKILGWICCINVVLINWFIIVLF